MVSSVPKTIGIYKIEYQCVYTMAIYILNICIPYIGIEIPPTISSVYIDLIRDYIPYGRGF